MEDNITPQQKESIKLMKMSKGYNWEIKIIEDKLGALDLGRLEVLDEKLREKYLTKKS